MNHPVNPISNSRIKSIQNLGPVFEVIDKAQLINQATPMGLTFVDSEENLLPNGKSLITVRF